MIKPSELVSNYGQYSKFIPMIPGLNFIRQQVIKPLLFATEKVVEFMHEDTQDQQGQPVAKNNPECASTERLSVK